MEKNYLTTLDFIKFTKAGIKIASYSEVMQLLTARYKEIYGNDIELSNTADGIFLETMSLLFTNILSTVQILYNNLNINNANGIYLDSLSALSGVYRKDATKSTAQLEITSKENEDITIDENNPLIFKDQGNQTWTTILQDKNSIILQKDVKTTVLVQCTTNGPINATKGWITELVNQSYNLIINQEVDAEVGTNRENDIQFRERRAASISSRSVTVLQGLNAALLSLLGIDDCLIYENSTSANKTSFDGTTISPHSIYVILRKRQNIDIPDSTIGSIIYEKLTPGIQTTEMNNTVVTGVDKQYKYQQYVLGRTNAAGIDQIVYWKQCTPITTGVTITATLKKGNAYYSNTPQQYILPAIIEYLNGLPISYGFSVYDLIQVINNADIAVANIHTFTCTNAQLTLDDTNTSIIISGEGINQTYATKDTYFNWTNAKITQTDSGETVTITIKVTNS